MDKKEPDTKLEGHQKVEKGSLFGQPGPVKLGGRINDSFVGPEDSAQLYQTSKPFEPAPPAYEPSMPDYAIPAPVGTPAIETPAVETVSPTSYPSNSPSYPSSPPPSQPMGYTQSPVQHAAPAPAPPAAKEFPISNASVSWSPTPWKPRIERSALIHPSAMLYGNVKVEDRVFVAASAIIRGENDEPIHIGMESNVQEGVVLRDLPSRRDGVDVKQRIVDVGDDKYSLYIGKRVSLTPQCQVHGPAFIGDGVYIGMQSLVFWARVEKGVIIEPGCLIMNVTIPTGKFVPAGIKVTNQKMVSDLPPLTSKYRFYGINDETVEACLEMLRGYRNLFK